MGSCLRHCSFIMAACLRKTLQIPALRLACSRAMSGGQSGDGAGKGGGAGGSIRSSGGAFGKMEVAQEEQYFRKLQAQQLERMHELIEDDIAHHERQIRQHQEAIDHHKKKMNRLEKQKGSGSDSD